MNKKSYTIKTAPYSNVVKEWIATAPTLVIDNKGTLRFDRKVFRALALGSGLKTKSIRAIKKRVKLIIITACLNGAKNEKN